MRICTTCVLPESFPSARLGEDGRCRYCSSNSKTKLDQQRLRSKFYNLIDKIRGTGPYDVMVAYSGGKDSTYTLRLLKEQFELRIIAVTFDNGFVSTRTLENCRAVTSALEIDHFIFRPAETILLEIFKKSLKPGLYPMKALERASSICNSCMNLVKSFVLKLAIEMNVPAIAYGWSPGQAPMASSLLQPNAAMIQQNQKIILKLFRSMVDNKVDSMFLDQRHYDRGRLPSFIHPLAFSDYKEADILKSIAEIGWMPPDDTDANSTNCLLNSFGNEVHLRQYGFHPYAFEIAGLVRDGYMSREDGILKLNTPPNPNVLDMVKQKLGVDEIPQ